MSISSAREFIEAGKTQSALRAKVSARISGLSDDAMVPALVEVAAANGWKFSADEYKSAASEAAQSLSPEQLDKVSGGGYAILIKGEGSSGSTEWILIFNT